MRMGMAETIFQVQRSKVKGQGHDQVS